MEAVEQIVNRIKADFQVESAVTQATYHFQKQEQDYLDTLDKI